MNIEELLPTQNAKRVKELSDIVNLNSPGLVICTSSNKENFRLIETLVKDEMRDDTRFYILTTRKFCD
jgi:hypothetical protein